MKKETSTIPDCVSQRLWLLATALVFSANASAWDCTEGGHNIDINNPAYLDTCQYGIKPGTSMPPETIEVIGTGSTVVWTRGLTSKCTAAANGINCSGLTVKIPGYPNPGTAVLPTAKVELGGTAPNPPSGAGDYSFSLTVQDASGLPEATRSYMFRVAADGGGWGDPHITTVDGVHYDFQSAGEFTALRGGGMEIQTRQTPVPTTYIPGANDYTGLASCVSIYTAIAAKVGIHRVSYQQSSTDAKVMELRVDGVLTTLGAEGINLESQSVPASPVGVVTPTIERRIAKPAERLNPEARNLPVHPLAAVPTLKIGGRIVKSATGDGIEIHYVDGTKVVVTQAWWDAQQKWYLNVNAFDTTATEGIMGSIAQGSWLPALANGQSVGPRPGAAQVRYTQLNKTFADSWRVTNATSLFDYAPGTSTQTFMLADWPRESPTTCAIGNQKTVQSLSAVAAQKQCSGIIDENTRKNCIFDVRATGYTGFAKTYLIQEKLRGVTAIGRGAIEKVVRPGERVTLIVPKEVNATKGLVQIIVDGKNYGAPVLLDATGQAVLSTTNLPAGTHRIETKFVKPSLRGIGTEINRAVVPVQPNMK